MGNIFNLENDWQQIENFFSKNKSVEQTALNAVQNTLTVIQGLAPLLAPLEVNPEIAAIVKLGQSDIAILQAGISKLEALVAAQK